MCICSPARRAPWCANCDPRRFAASLARITLAYAVLASIAVAAPQRQPRTFTIPLDSGVTSLTVEVSGKGSICGPARVTDSNGRILVALAAGHCVATDK